MKENRVIIVTMILNFVVAVIKLVSGIVFSFSTLIADSVQSFMDFVTDIISLVVNKIGKRRANKRYPFGFGQAYYVANLITGALLFLIGIFIVCQVLFFKGEFKPTKELFIILGICLLLKIIVVSILRTFGKKFKSEMMIEASKESNADVISTCVVLIVSIIILFQQYLPEWLNVDKIGSICMAIYVFYTAIRMIVANIKGILSNTEENDDIKEKIVKELDKYKEIDFKEISIMKMSTYYNVFLKVKVDDKLTIRKYLMLEKKVKKDLKSKEKQIRFIDIIPN